MMLKILQFLMPFFVVAVLSFSGWAYGFYSQPQLVELVYILLTEHPFATGVWLALSIIGIDFARTATADAISYRNVGAKAAAHRHLRGDKK